MVDFATSEAGLRFTCPACGQETFLENPAAGTNGEPRPEKPPAEVSAVVAAEVVCPKCGHAQRDNYACHQCGLVFSNFDPASLPPVPGDIEQLWQQITARPGDESLHRQFQQQVLAAGLLEYATRQYRLLGRLPGHQEVAERMLQQLRTQAQARLLPGALVAGPPDRQPRHGQRWLFLLALAVVFGLLWFAWQHGAFSFLGI